MSHKPDGYTSLAPYLIVEDAERTLRFVDAVFGAEPLRIFRHDDGAIMHAEARIDDTVLMMGQADGGPAAHVHVYVPDVDAAFTRAVEAGASVIQEAMEKGDGDRRAGVRDDDGHTWWLSTQVAAA